MATNLQSLPFITKVVRPKLRGDAVSRSRLLDVLKAGMARRVLILTAPAGYGKTTALNELATQANIPVCWYTLAPEDREPIEFVRYCAKAIELSAGPLPSLEAAKSREAPGQGWRNLLGNLVTAIYTDLRGELLFIFDDLHHISQHEGVKEAMALFIERAPGNIRFVLAGRVRPSLSCLPRLAVQDEVSTLDTSDLAFSKEETAALLSAIMHRPVQEREAQSVFERTTGWAAGIVLLARTKKTLDQLPQDSGGRDAPLFDYLAEEVLLKLPDNQRRFLLSTSVLREFTPELCDALLDCSDSGDLVQDLRFKGCFIEEIPAPMVTYRYHDLFREFLERSLKSRNSELHKALHRKAATLVERRGDDDVALFHLIAAGDYAEAGLYLQRVGEAYFERGKWQTLLGWLSLLPDHILYKQPALVLLQARLQLRSGQPDGALKGLESIISSAPVDGAILGRALVAKASACRLLGQMDSAADSARRGLEVLTKANASSCDLSEGYRQLASAQATRGEFIEALRSFEQALALAPEADFQLRSLVHDGTAGAYVELGQLDMALAHLEKARQGWLKLKNEGALAESLNNLAFVYYYQGEFGIALDELMEAERAAAAAGYQRLVVTVRISQGIVRSALGDHKVAVENLLGGLQGARSLPDHRLVAQATSWLGNAYRKLGELGKAEVLLRQAIAEAEESGQKYFVVCYQASLGKVLSGAGDMTGSLAVLQKAEGQFREQGNLRDVAEVKLHQGLAMYRLGRLPDALKATEELERDLEQLGYEGFLIPDAEEARELLHLSIAKGIGRGRLEALLRRLSRQAQPEDAWRRRKRSLPRVRVLGFGQAEVSLEGHKVADNEWRSRKAKEALFFLLCKKAPVTKDELIEVLWPNAEPGEREDVLRMSILRLRRAVYPELILTQGDGYAVNPEVPVEFDKWQFEGLRREANGFKEGSDSKAEMLGRAVALYRGPFLEEVYSDWCTPLRRTLELQYHEALMALAAHALGAAKPAQAIELVDSILASDPYQEEAVILLARAYLQMGDSPTALKRMREYNKLAQEELCAEPSKDFIGFYNSALTHGSGIGMGVR